MSIKWRKTEYGECSRLEDVPIGCHIESIDDVYVIATCESCGRPILDGQVYLSLEDADLCPECTKEMQETI
jgi:hypothetical protein